MFHPQVQIAAAKPFLENVLIQVAHSLSSSMPNDPNSHVSDFRTQPRADSRFENYEVDPVEDNKNSTATDEREDESPPASSTGILFNGTGFRLFPWLRSNDNSTETYSDIIGNIIGSARKRITTAFQRLLSPLRRHRQQFHSQPEVEPQTHANDAPSESLMDSLKQYVEKKSTETKQS